MPTIRPILYHYPKCSTCKKAIAFLRARGVDFEAVDISLSPPSEGELRAMMRAQGAIRPLFNVSGNSYRSGGFAQRVPTMTEEEAIAALLHDGMLIKRPFLLGEGIALLGFDPDRWARLG